MAFKNPKTPIQNPEELEIKNVAEPISPKKYKQDGEEFIF